MLKPYFERKFKKDIDLAIKRGKKFFKLKVIINDLINEVPLAEKHRNHKLKGEFEGCWECHIEPDWLLVYRIDVDMIIFIRTGTHSDLF